MTERQINALILAAIGLGLMVATEPLAKTIAGSAPPLVTAGVYFPSPIGLIFLVIGIYRAATKGKSS